MVRAPIEEIRELPGDPLGGASGDKRMFSALHIGKQNAPGFPFTIANELVASFVGATLGLRVPPVLAFGQGEDILALVQMSDRDARMQQGPPVTARALEEYVHAHAHEVHGAVIFDLYVGNNDRAFGPERRNLLLDERRRLVLFDQGNACYYRDRPSAGIEAGIPRLEAVSRDLDALRDMDHKQNLYWRLLTDWGMVDDWCSRIAQLPEYVIDAAIARIPDELIRPTLAERAALRTFLVTRRNSLREQIIAHPDMFPGLPGR